MDWVAYNSATQSMLKEYSYVNFLKLGTCLEHRTCPFH
jgi:hypothetical protein